MYKSAFMVNQESPDAADKERRQASPAAHVSLEFPARRRILHRVPPQVRENKKHIYDPMAVSLGPYHRGRPEFRWVEAFKDEVLDIVLNTGPVVKIDKGLVFRSKILDRVDEIRSFYGGLSKDEYDDEALAEMMLRDACFVVYCMESRMENGDEKLVHIVHRLGMSRFGLIFNDLFVLENQIPLWVIKLLSCDDNDDDGDDDEPLLYKFFGLLVFGHHRVARVPHENRAEEPLHVLDAFRSFVFNFKKESSVSDPMKMKRHSPIFEFRRWRRKSSKNSYFQQVDSPFGSVTELKAKGICFGLSSYCLNDIRFESYLFYGKLQLPHCVITDGTKVFFSNMVAFEMSPESNTDFAVTSYVSFMKSLIDSSDDVKELRDRDVISSTLGNDEEIVKIFKEINGYDFYNNFQDVRMRINAHCNSKAKTWMAEFTHTYFRSPWNAIALFAATVLLCLTFLQTYYAIRPRAGWSN